MLFNISSINSSRRGQCILSIHLDGAVKVNLELDLKTSRYVNLKEGEACQQVSLNTTTLIPSSFILLKK